MRNFKNFDVHIDIIANSISIYNSEKGACPILFISFKELDIYTKGLLFSFKEEDFKKGLQLYKHHLEEKEKALDTILVGKLNI